MFSGSGRKPNGKGSGRPAGGAGREAPAAAAPGPPRAPRNAAHAAAAPPAPGGAPASGKTRFRDLGLPEELLRAVADLKFAACTPVQALALPPALAGKDIAGRAQTGTGKTAAFLITLFTRFLRHPPGGALPNGTPRGLILAPTRELAIQIHKDAVALARHTPLRVAVVYGGMDYGKQQAELARNQVDLVVATPGRLLDFKSKHVLTLSRVEALVIDEADRMLDMGFIPDVRRIVYSLPPKHKRQTMLFSATLDEAVMRLASAWMVDPVKVSVESEAVTVDSIDQRVYMVAARQKSALLLNLLIREPVERMLVFRNRRDGVDRLARRLAAYGISCAALSGDVAQERRLRILEDFRTGRLKVVVATDVAGRGIHVEGISHVINYDVPFEAEDYVHRIGRTGRAGASGTAITLACEEGSFNLPAIEAFIGRRLPYTQPEESWLTAPPLPAGARLPAETAVGARGRARPSGPRGRRPPGGRSPQSGRRPPSGARRPAGPRPG